MRLARLAASMTIIGTFIALVASVPPAAASCAAPRAIPDGIAQADLVVVGTVTATRSRDRIATIAIDEHWKGDAGSTVEVYGGPAQDNTATSVDRTYRVGTRYLVFAFEPAAHNSPGTFGGRYEDTNCSTTQSWTDSLAQFRPTTATIVPPPTTSAPATRPAASGRAGTTPWFIGVAAVAAVVGLAIAIRHRRHATA